MGRKPIGDAPMTTAQRQRLARAVTKQDSVTVPMTRTEQQDLLKAIRRREHVALADARE
jgi:NAD(P)H-dependent flavin oxidoreductase YrpB (nitropropane dioxygenase family)